MNKIIIKVNDTVVYEGDSGNVEVKTQSQGNVTQVINNMGSIGNQVTIGGVTYGGGSSVSINAGVKVEIEGDVTGNVKASGSVTCKNVGGSVDASGSVNCHDVPKDVDAGGSVHCGNVQGDVDAGGSVNCGNIGGSCDAGGSIRRN